MTSQTFDLIVRGGTVYDGSGGEPFVSDVAIDGDRIAVIGANADAQAGVVIDASGLAVALQDGEHTGTFSGRALYGPGKK